MRNAMSSIYLALNDIVLGEFSIEAIADRSYAS